ncbi:Mammalian cell entry related domain protein [Pseudopedobacter saltans DSM 12145]|uniref:Mammalian cell entry related domain protein n=1 Tax=Pseudopedobacter saltans (strain ATCC 51119 / DSM 12145 / JCM 21818 / CCUG 39354 / LMG 10337 / NBRC 100064 / NCIMB 13643) TaxID=762903 RepID=F0S4J5_PSESL|nr:MlaD family protein [Pseudopedobacter saltans]ADY51986.1 Mammalian cell entry related domain protein [Pseudopedobacter saltans DSM 12145]
MKISNETKVGILASFAIAIFIIGYNFLKGNDVFTQEKDFYAIYDKVDGLTVSKPVLVNGYQIGRVAALTLQQNGKILANFKIAPKYDIPKNTIARLESTDLLGSKAVVFDLGNSTAYAADGDTLNSNIQANILDQMEPVQKKAQILISRLDSVLVSVNNILNPNFQKNIESSFNSIAGTLQTLESTSKTVDGMVTVQSKRIDNILANAESISANLKNNNEQITGILTNFNKVSDEIAKANFKQTLENANQAVADLQTAINKVNKGNGSLALLLNDDKLYNNLNNASHNLDKLMIDLRANPKRYVSFSVFGGKKD